MQKKFVIAGCAAGCIFASGYLLARAQSGENRETFKKEVASAKAELLIRGLLAQTASPEAYAAQTQGTPDPGDKYAAVLAKAVDDPIRTQDIISLQASSFAETKDAQRTLVELALVQTAQNARIIQLLKQSTAH